MFEQFPHFRRDLIRALQICYYVHDTHVITDKEYDIMQSKYENDTGDYIPVGSDIPEHYTLAERYLAAYLITRMTQKND